ncbi:MAG: hypothetical protein AAFX93_03245 [Verrucomicrobiota bacterium]
MKSTSKLVLATIALGIAALFTGCDSVPSNSHELYSKNNQGFNALGIVDVSPDSYKHIGNESSVAYSNELAKRKNISGDNISLFWGAVVFADY